MSIARQFDLATPVNGALAGDKHICTHEYTQLMIDCIARTALLGLFLGACILTSFLEKDASCMLLLSQCGC